MSAIDNLHNRIDFTNIPFTDRSSRILMFRRGNELYFRLAERWEKWQSKWGHYRQRSPIVDHFVFLDSDGQPLPFDVDTYPHEARLLTAQSSFACVYTDPETLLIHLPPGQHRFQFVVQAENGQIDRRGGILRGVRNVAYTTNARLIANEMRLLEEGDFQVNITIEADNGSAFLLNLTPRLGFNRSVPPPEGEREAARKRWEQWFSLIPPVQEVYRARYEYAWWIMRAGLLSQRFYFTREALAPSKIHYVGVWQWDQFFHAIAYRHVDMRLAEDQIRIVLDHQRNDGMLPDAIYDEGLVTHLTAPVDADVTKPPLAAWAVLKLFEVSRHYDFLEEAYEPLIRWHQWWMSQNSDSSGLCMYRHPFSSGLDDSPLWDSGMPVTPPDLNTYLVVQQDTLARIAEHIGKPEDAARFREAAAALTQKMLDVLWDERLGMFMAMHNGDIIPVITPFSLLPLWTGRLPEDKLNRLLNHLTDPTKFWTDYPLATVSISDPKFDPMQMWRGPSWPNINYLFVEALTQIGQDALAQKLRRATLNLIMRLPDIYEYYNPLTGERPPKAAPIFGWTSAVFIDLAVQEARG